MVSQFPSLGGVAVAKRLTGWLHRKLQDRKNEGKAKPWLAEYSVLPEDAHQVIVFD